MTSAITGDYGDSLLNALDCSANVQQRPTMSNNRHPLGTVGRGAFPTAPVMQ
jgi:hypothetical protein